MFDNVNMNFRSLKESRGFLKVLQFFLALLVLSTAVSTVFDVKYSVKCADKVQTFHPIISYPFVGDESSISYKFSECQKSESTHIFKLNLKSGSLSRFYVFMVVISFLYSLGVMIYFVFFELDITQPGADRHQILYYTIDMGMSLFIFVFGLFACFGFMSVSTTLSYYAKGDVFIHDFRDVCKNKEFPCTVVNNYNHANIVSSILFQLVHIGIWAFSFYMMWKDQVWKPVTTMPYDNDPSQITTQGYGSGFGGNDYDYTYQS